MRSAARTKQRRGVDNLLDSVLSSRSGSTCKKSGPDDFLFRDFGLGLRRFAFTMAINEQVVRITITEEGMCWALTNHEA